MGARLLTYQKRVVIHKVLRTEIVEWYHLNLVHLGAMRAVFYWSGMEKTIVEYCKKCITCKKGKLHGGP
ncbi:hypothetical protein L914_19030 [Phytophthora nicotianae]|uniref:Integrase zinc-binding domain-containing protein n=1 Tax=Phytophthora nicotianae TaxID=4792 RepID=W2MBR1_PHYNI|nr:hypothetical protein L914_19030 [Phytophthora nicotianae]